MEPKISFASSSFDSALGFTPGMLSALLRVEAPDCRWAVLRDWDSGRWAQRLLYMHSALSLLEHVAFVRNHEHALCLSKM